MRFAKATKNERLGSISHHSYDYDDYHDYCLLRLADALLVASLFGSAPPGPGRACRSWRCEGSACAAVLRAGVFPRFLYNI